VEQATVLSPDRRLPQQDPVCKTDAIQFWLYKALAPAFFAAAQCAFASADSLFRAAGLITQKEIVGRLMVPGLALGAPPELHTYAASAPLATCSCPGSLAASEPFRYASMTSSDSCPSHSRRVFTLTRLRSWCQQANILRKRCNSHSPQTGC
jgi:hypothetical protein